MPRSFPEPIATRITKSGTFPTWFLRLDADGSIHRIASTGHDVTRQGFTWSGAGLRVSEIDESNPNAKVYVEIPNMNNWVTNLLQSKGIEHEAIIYRSWAESPDQTAYALDDFIQVFTGIVGGAPALGAIARLELVSTNAARLYPFLRMAPPTNNFNWPVDQPVIFNNKTFKVVE